MAETNSKVFAEDRLIDTTGLRTGVPFNLKLLFSVAGTIIIYIALNFVTLSAYGDNCAKALAFACATIFWMITTPCEMAVSAFLIAALGTMAGVITWSDVKNRLGSSAFYTVLGMAVVAMGIRFTPFGQRLAYWLLYRFGQKPVRLVVIIGFMTAIISAFVSHLAVLILVSGICHKLLLTMGEKPGESKLGKTLMLTITMASNVGGMGLINGAPTGNLQGIALMNAASGNLNLMVTYVNWAKISVPTLLITIVPCLLIYVFVCGLKNRDLEMPPPAYYKEYLDNIGKMGGSEYRWLIITIGMVTAMLTGMNTAQAALLFAALCMLPGVGVSNCKDVLTVLPWGVLMCVCMCPLIGTIITNNGVSDLLNAVITPLFGQMGPLAFSILSTMVFFLAMNLMVNADYGVQALVVTLTTTLCIGLGYDPRTVLLPVMLASGWMWAIGANYIVMMNKEYGWWEMKDPALPGFVTGFFLCIAVPVINYILTPLWGLSFYL